MEKIVVMLHKGCGEKHITKFHTPFPIHYGIFLSVGFSLSVSHGVARSSVGFVAGLGSRKP